MTVASEITRIEGNIEAAYTAASAKGATLPATENSDNLATCIGTITGSSPVITSLSVTPTTSAQTITAPSGTDGYSPISVAAVTSSIDSNISAGNIKDGVTILGVTGNYTGGGGGSSKYGATIDMLLGDVDYSGNLFYPAQSGSLEFTGVVNLYPFSLYYKFVYSTGLTSVSFPDLESQSLNTSISPLTGCFQLCMSLTTARFPKLRYVVTKNMFKNVFYSCEELTNLYFNNINNSDYIEPSCFNQMFNENSGWNNRCTLHFPSNVQSKIQGLTGYPTFGGDSSKIIIAFDLTAT